MAVISLDFSATATCPSETPDVLAHALTHAAETHHQRNHTNAASSCRRLPRLHEAPWLPGKNQERLLCSHESFRHLVTHTDFQGLDIHDGKQTSQRFVQGHSVFERKELQQPVEPVATELGDACTAMPATVPIRSSFMRLPGAEDF
tara:strand:- start:162892 stop:163329 length:438 start_codon:yes stop_codon:yes gene_type:complete